jgi:hypothetical protein
VGVDIHQPPEDFFDALERHHLCDRVALEIGSQDDIPFLERVIGRWFKGKELDIVIDDASHLYNPTKATFDYVFHNHLRSGGIYIIEDWGAGYWPKWPDGNPDGMHGLPLLIKELVDDCALIDRTMLFQGERSLPVEEEQRSKIKRLIIQSATAVIIKV